MSPKKLIEVSIPLEAINEQSAREKSINHKHPSTLHLWWSRKPLATARAVLWASLIDDPSEHPEKFPTPEEQDKERKRLHEILAKLVDWDNITHSKNADDPEIVRKARAELPDSLPELLDPFAGGGSIPLEGQRLGLRVHAHDLNPIAVLINKAMTELPAKFCDMPPVNPEARKLLGWENSGNGTHGLAKDIEYYGGLLREKALAKLGSMYPQIMTREGSAKVIAWLWARTVKCPNPSCGCEMPLVSSWELSRKQKMHVRPRYENGTLSFRVESGDAPESPKTGKGVFRCSACGSAVQNDYLHDEFCAHRDGVRMIAVVAEKPGGKGRLYLSPDEDQVKAADVPMPEDYPDQEMPEKALGFRVQAYGFTHWHELFTNRQLTMLTAIADLIPEVVNEAERDAESAGRRDAKEYAEALGVYFAFVLDKMLLRHSMFSAWDRGYDKIMMIFGRQAVPMVWDFAEANPFSDSSGSFSGGLKDIVDVVDNLPGTPEGEASQHNATECETLRNMLISTDPPYYDNIGYADLSDYFYIWLRRTLRDTYPGLFTRMLVPKKEELVAAPHRHGGDKMKARECFEAGMLRACKNLYECACSDYPATIYYAYKSGDKDGGNSGWETMLEAVIKAGFQITGTWPMRTELTSALKAKVAALASSVVLVCRKRSPDAPGTSKAGFVRELRRELEPALKKMQEGNIAAVDLQQSAIGPGMAVYSKYSEVVGPDGDALGVHDALIEINSVLAEILGTGIRDIDGMSGFCTDVYRIKGFNPMKAGDAISLANTRSVTLDGLIKAGLIEDMKGEVRIFKREELKECKSSSVWVLTQKMVYAREFGDEKKDGVNACANIVKRVGLESAQKARDLAYYLYTFAERRNWSGEAVAYNSLVASWGEIVSEADKISHPLHEQLTAKMEEE